MKFDELCSLVLEEGRSGFKNKLVKPTEDALQIGYNDGSMEGLVMDFFEDNNNRPEPYEKIRQKLEQWLYDKARLSSLSSGAAIPKTQIKKDSIKKLKEFISNHVLEFTESIPSEEEDDEAALNAIEGMPDTEEISRAGSSFKDHSPWANIANGKSIKMADF